jgi:SAM-dependent methyltransferase
MRRQNKMTSIDENVLSMLLPENVDLRLIEPHIFSVLSDIEVSSTYDTQFGNIYDWVACNPIYNRLMWGYSITIFASIANDALRSTNTGNVLDLGCGSLAFTAKTYIQYSERPVILVDQSLKMLRIAKSRLIKINGTVPDNMVFLHADALRLPFREKSYDTIISENLLHCLNDTKSLLKGLKNILSEDGKMYFTTLVKGNRFADRYLEALANGDKLVSRSMGDHQTTFDQLGMTIKCNIIGNLASIYYND